MMIGDVRYPEPGLKSKTENTGLWLGLGGFAVIGVLLFYVRHLLAHPFGYHNADIAVSIPGFFAIFVVQPIKHRYERWAYRRYCARHAHVWKSFDYPNRFAGRSCERCGETIFTR